MNRNTETLLYAVLAAALGAYTLLRAWLLPVTVDESTTVFNHVPRIVVDTLTFHSEANPNNHILNTLAIKILTGTFGWHPVVVRLPVLMGAGLYFWAAVQLSRRMSEAVGVRFFILVLLLGNPFQLEFFSLARGYGLAAGLMLAALWQAWRYLEANQGDYLRNAFILAGLAVYANFTMLVFFAPFCALLLLSAWQSSSSLSDFWQKNRPALTALAIFAVLWAVPLRQLSRHPEILHWNELGSLFKSVELSVKAALMGNAYLGDGTVRIFTWLAATFAAGMMAVAAVRWRRQGWRFVADPRLFIAAMLPGVLATNILQVYLTKTPYLEPRMATFYWSVFALQLGVAAAWLWQRRGRRAWIFMAPVWLFTVLNLSRSVNLTKSAEWWFDRDTYLVLDYLKKAYIAEGRKEAFTLDAHHVMLNSLMFHLERDPRGYDRYAKLVPWHGLRPPARDNDFYYAISREEVKEIMGDYEVVQQPTEYSCLLLRKKK
jgi:hypothetical protein